MVTFENGLAVPRPSRGYGLHPPKGQYPVAPGAGQYFVAVDVMHELHETFHGTNPDLALLYARSPLR